MGNGTASSDLELKLKDVRSTGIHSEITAVERNGKGYKISVVPQPQEKSSPEEILAMNFYGFLQRVFVGAGAPRAFDWSPLGGPVIQIFDLGWRQVPKLSVIAEVSQISNGNGTHVIGVSPVHYRVGSYSTRKLMGYWANQLPGKSS